MAHLKDRFCLIPFSELTDCPEAKHHAIGSPHFDSEGKPKFTEPIFVAVRADLFDSDLPRCTALAASSNTRPYQSYGPVMRKIFSLGDPHSHPEVRRGLEGVMEVGQVRELPPGGLVNQAEKVLIGCVAPMSGSATKEHVHEVITSFAHKFSKFPWGATLRMPLIGTGAAREGETTTDIFRQTIYMMNSHFSPHLLPPDPSWAPRRLLLFHPSLYEARLIGTILGQRAIFLTILDKMGIYTNDKRFVYGLAQGPEEENELVESEETFLQALDHFDQALDCLLEGREREALKKAAQGMEAEPHLTEMCRYISSFAEKKDGLLGALIGEALSLAGEGRIRDGFCVAQALIHLGGEEKYEHFIKSLREGYMHHCVASLEARLLYERYIETEAGLQAIRQGATLSHANLSGEITLSSDTVKKRLLENLRPLYDLEEKIPHRAAENCFHIAIRKLLGERIEPQGARQTIENLKELAEMESISLSSEKEKKCEKFLALIEDVENQIDKTPTRTLYEQIIGRLVEFLPHHGTLRLEACRHCLQPRGGSKNLAQKDTQEAWKHLMIAHEKHPRDYGILSYMGFLIFFQGNKFLPQAYEFYSLFARLVEDELENGRFSKVHLKSPGGEMVEVPFPDELTQNAYEYYEKYRNLAQCFAQLAKTLRQSEGSGALEQYRRGMKLLEEVGRYDLVELYGEVLGENWVLFQCRHSESIGTIPTPFGEISLDFIVIIYRKIRHWWKYSYLKSAQLQEAMRGLIRQLGKTLELK